MEAGETLRRFPHAGGLADHDPEAVGRARGARPTRVHLRITPAGEARRGVTFRDSAGASFTLRYLPPPPGPELSVKLLD